MQKQILLGWYYCIFFLLSCLDTSAWSTIFFGVGCSRQLLLVRAAADEACEWWLKAQSWAGGSRMVRKEFRIRMKLLV